jgi:hypothetical protein
LIYCYTLDIVSGSAVKCEEGFFFLSYKHETIVIISFVISGQLDVGDHGVIVFVLDEGMVTLSSLVLNQSLAFPYLTGMELNNEYTTIKN